MFLSRRDYNRQSAYGHWNVHLDEIKDEKNSSGYIYLDPNTGNLSVTDLYYR